MANLVKGKTYDAGTMIGQSGIMPLDWAKKYGYNAKTNPPHLCIVTDAMGHEQLVQVLDNPPVISGKGTGGGGLSYLKHASAGPDTVTSDDLKAHAGVTVHFHAGAVVVHASTGHQATNASITRAIMDAAEQAFRYGPASGSHVQHLRGV
jgi:hypothetical protein